MAYAPDDPTHPHPNTDHLEHLGSDTHYQYDGADAGMLETFENPMITGDPTIRIEAPEFTSLCPKTGQPDFATIVVEYGPRALCVESKSYKLYLGSFRNHKSFHEACVQKIAKDLIEALDPEWLVVEGQFTPRGGIPFWPKIVYNRQGE